MEIIAVLAVVSVGLLGVLTLVIQNIQIQFINKNALIASQLAQEGLELVRAKRDTNWLLKNSWNDSITPGNYIIDAMNTWQNGIVDINNPEAKLYIQGFGGIESFAHTTTSYPTNFRRLITIQDLVAGQSLKIISTAQYEQGGNKYQYVAETDLYNWGER